MEEKKVTPIRVPANVDMDSRLLLAVVSHFSLLADENDKEKINRLNAYAEEIERKYLVGQDYGDAFILIGMMMARGMDCLKELGTFYEEEEYKKKKEAEREKEENGESPEKLSAKQVRRMLNRGSL